MSRVPNNNSYGLTDVRDAVKSHSPSVQDNLDSCFNYAIASYFDPNYNNNTYAGESTGRSLKRFRNYGKTYEIQTLRILDAPSQFANEVNWQNLQPGVNYYLELRLNNPDSTFVKNIGWRIHWSDTHPVGRYDYTWLFCSNVAIGDKYIVFDHDLPDGPGLIKYRVSDKPAVFDSPGTYYSMAVASNYGGIFYLTFKAKPYANFHSSIKKTINLFNTAQPGGDSVSFVNPNRTFLVSYIQDNSFKFFYPTAISVLPTSRIWLYGFNYEAFVVRIIDRANGQALYTSPPIYASSGQTAYFDYLVQIAPGQYYIILYDLNFNQLENVGTLTIV